VQVVRLIRTPFDMNHMLVTQKYDVRLFCRVEEYFQRFYIPSNSASVTLDEVGVIFNSALEEQFGQEDAGFTKRFRGLVELRDQNQSDAQQVYLNRLLTSKNLVTDCNSNPISAWHGVSSKHLDSVCWYGLLNLSTKDSGIVSHPLIIVF
jgi:hypothetical protein